MNAFWIDVWTCDNVIQIIYCLFVKGHLKKQVWTYVHDLDTLRLQSVGIRHSPFQKPQFQIFSNILLKNFGSFVL